MIRVTNKKDQETPVVYVDREVSKVVYMEPLLTNAGSNSFTPTDDISGVLPIQSPQIAYDYNQVITHTITTPGPTEYILLPADLSPIQSELDLQSRALVSLKAERQLERARRLTLIKKLKKQRDEHNKSLKKLKLAVVASLTLSILSLLIRK